MNHGARNWDDAQIHAHVDGELDAERAAQLEADCLVDSALAGRVAQQRHLRTLLATTFDPVLQETVPERLQAALRGPSAGAATVPIGIARSARRPAWTAREWSALAATLVLGVLAGAMALRPFGGTPFRDSHQGLLASGSLEDALTSRIAGDSEQGLRTAIIASFMDGTGRICRAFRQESGTAGLACQHGGRWRIEALSSTSASPGDEPQYRQAGSALPPAIVSAMEELHTGDPLTAEQERQLRDRHWQGL